jgi:hypothetical protein
MAVASSVTVGKLCGCGLAMWPWASCVAVGKLCGCGLALWPWASCVAEFYLVEGWKQSRKARTGKNTGSACDTLHFEERFHTITPLQTSPRGLLMPIAQPQYEQK